jgi:hypothetical protein
MMKVALATVSWSLMNHRPYSLDIAPNDSHMFGPVKVHVERQKFQTYELKCGVLNELYC